MQDLLQYGVYHLIHSLSGQEVSSMQKHEFRPVPHHQEESLPGLPRNDVVKRPMDHQERKCRLPQLINLCSAHEMAPALIGVEWISPKS